MITVLDLLNAIENSRAGYDDPIRIVRPVVGREAEAFEIVDLKYNINGGSDGIGELKIVLSKIAEPANLDR